MFNFKVAKTKHNLNCLISDTVPRFFSSSEFVFWWRRARNPAVVGTVLMGPTCAGRRAVPLIKVLSRSRALYSRTSVMCGEM
jgi:hypothetical protein